MGALCEEDSTKYACARTVGDIIYSRLLEQTALIGRISEEFNCLPVENEEFRKISEARALEALKPKAGVHFVEKIPAHLLLQRHALPSDKGTFVVCAQSCLNRLVIYSHHSSKLPRPPNPSHKKTRLRVLRKTSCWTRFSSASANTNTGHLGPSNSAYNSLKLISSKLWRWWHI